MVFALSPADYIGLFYLTEHHPNTTAAAAAAADDDDK